MSTTHYNLEFLNSRKTFKPVKWTLDWSDQGSNQQNIYTGSVKVTSIEDGAIAPHKHVNLRIRFKKSAAKGNDKQNL